VPHDGGSPIEASGGRRWLYSVAAADYELWPFLDVGVSRRTSRDIASGTAVSEPVSAWTYWCAIVSATDSSRPHTLNWSATVGVGGNTVRKVVDGCSSVDIQYIVLSGGIDSRVCVLIGETTSRTPHPAGCRIRLLHE